MATSAFALLLWTAADLWIPRRGGFRDFDAAAVGRLDGDMWRSYYERKPARLFWQLAQSLRIQFHTGFWRSFPMAYRAARAAFVFKDGRNREQYARALPDLERYFAQINALADAPFDAHSAAQKELEWWIIRREPARYSTKDWERLIAAVVGDIYHMPPERFAGYARLRVAAMVLRDTRGAAITEQDWSQIRQMLEQSWSALGRVLHS